MFNKSLTVSNVPTAATTPAATTSATTSVATAAGGDSVTVSVGSGGFEGGNAFRTTT